jgi:hypothetical protein
MDYEHTLKSENISIEFHNDHGKGFRYVGHSLLTDRIIHEIPAFYQLEAFVWFIQIYKISYEFRKNPPKNLKELELQFQDGSHLLSLERYYILDVENMQLTSKGLTYSIANSENHNNAKIRMLKKIPHSGLKNPYLVNNTFIFY